MANEPENTTAAPSTVLSWPLRLGGALLLVMVMLGGILVFGRLASSDVVAMIFTAIFFVAVAVGVGVLVLRRRSWLLPLGLSYLLVAGGAGVVLGQPLITDDVVNEEVIRVAAPAERSEATSPAPEATQAPEPEAAEEPEPAVEEEGPRAIAQGSFVDVDHPGSGEATVVDIGDGSTVLTLTDFETDNGPDLFVYLVPQTAGADNVDGFVDLGSLKGNLGNQQYDIPDDVAVAGGWRVVVWCRAFSVSFTEATLS